MVDYLAGHDRPLRDPRVRATCRCRRGSERWRCSPATRSSGCATRSTWSSWSARKTDLRRVGSRWTGLCPFHDERTPSFSVNAEEKLYYCFGCQAKGDAFGFVEQTEGLDFREAVELLADRYGVRARARERRSAGRGAPAPRASGC